MRDASGTAKQQQEAESWGEAPSWGEAVSWDEVAIWGEAVSWGAGGRRGGADVKHSKLFPGVWLGRGEQGEGGNAGVPGSARRRRHL